MEPQRDRIVLFISVAAVMMFPMLWFILGVAWILTIRM